MIKLIKIFILQSFIVFFAMAQNEEFKTKDLFFSAGNYSEFARSVQTNNSGKVNNYDIAPAISAGVDFALPWHNLLVPVELGWVMTRNAENGHLLLNPLDASNASITKNIWAIRFGLKYPIKKFYFKVGVSNIFTVIGGKGGTTTLNNGNTTSTFYVPDQTRTAINNTLDLGIEYFINKSWAIRTDVLIFSLMKKESRQYSYLLSVNYYWDNPFSKGGLK